MPRRTLTILTKCDYGIRQLPKAGEESVPMTLGNGTESMFAGPHKPPTSVKEQSAAASSSPNRNILGVPMSELIRRSEAIQKSAMSRNRTIHEQPRNDELGTRTCFIVHRQGNVQISATTATATIPVNPTRPRKRSRMIHVLMNAIKSFDCRVEESIWMQFDK